MPEETEKSSYYSSWYCPIKEDVKQINNNEMMLEDENPVIAGITVRAGTLDALVDMMIDSFSPINGLQEENSDFVRVMLLMHQWFTTSENLAHCLITRFWNCDTPLKQYDSSCSDSYPSECAAFQYRARICHTFRYWIHMFPIHFDLNPTLTSITKEFQNHLHLYNETFTNLATHLDLSKLPSYDWARSMSVRNPPAKHTRKISLVFDHLEPSELADHITFLEHKVMRRIAFSEFKAYAECGTPQDNPRLERSISLFNGLTQWIQWMVLSKSLPQQRADVIVKFVHVAQKLLQQNNFSSLMSVVGGLSHSALARLSNTMACVPPESKKTLSELSELLESTSNFSNYRKALAEARGFKIPILGVHMKDLITLHVALPDTLENGLINFRKITQLSLIFQELWKLQNSVPNVAVNADLVNTLRLSLDTPFSEDELYELSLSKEPRNCLSPQSSPTRLAVFSEWAAGIGGPADAETLEKFYQAIVQFIMKNYDQNKDGYLSPEEFECAYANFPYIDPFSVIDSDRDGMISKKDFISYLLSTNSKAIRVAFQHDFNETTYFKPTFCAHCAGLLWGLIKQGYKCRDCGINAHKHCKELAVMECRRTSTTTSRSNSFAASDGIKIKTRRPWRKQFKSSNSNGDSNYSPRTSTESDPCTCDNGFVFVDESLTPSPRNTDFPKSPASRNPPSPSKTTSPGCGCRYETKPPYSQAPPTLGPDLSGEQCIVLQKVPPPKRLLS